MGPLLELVYVLQELLQHRLSVGYGEIPFLAPEVPVDFGVHAAVSRNFFFFLTSAVFCPFLNLFSLRHHHLV